MNRRRWKPWPLSLRTVLKRNNSTLFAKKVILPIALLFVLALPSNAQQTSFTIEQFEGSYRLSLALLNIDGEELLTALKEGYTAEITFNIRVYKKTDGILSLFGDRMVSEFHPAYTAHWDLFNNRYVVTGPEGGTHAYPSEELFLSYFLQLKDYRVENSYGEPENYYMLGSVLLNTMKLVPPLTILAPFLSLRQRSGDWERFELSSAEQPEGEG